MTRYRYSALTPSGQARKGLVEAASPEDAARILEGRGELAVRITDARGLLRFLEVLRQNTAGKIQPRFSMIYIVLIHHHKRAIRHVYHSLNFAEQWVTRQRHLLIRLS